MDVPVVTFNDRDYTSRIDEILGGYNIPDKFYEDMRESILNHEYCNIILSLLDDFTEFFNENKYANYSGAIIAEGDRMTRLLIKLHSPLIPHVY